MPQVIIPNGIALGAPGAAGSPVGYHFFDAGNPNSRTDPQGLLANCALGSVFAQSDSPAFWQKTGASSIAAPTGTWTQLS